MRGLALLALLVLVASAPPAPARRACDDWTGTIAGTRVRCCAGGGAAALDADVVGGGALWCHGTGLRRRSLRFIVRSVDQAGTLATEGWLCRRGPRPPRWHRPSRGCCALEAAEVEGTFHPLPPSDSPAPVVNCLPFLPGSVDIVALRAGVACPRRRGGAVLPAVDVRRGEPTTTTTATSSTTTTTHRCGTLTLTVGSLLLPAGGIAIDGAFAGGTCDGVGFHTEGPADASTLSLTGPCSGRLTILRTPDLGAEGVLRCGCCGDFWVQTSCRVP
jgi:hypothetical protein